MSYPQIGVADGHHPVSHNNYDLKQMAKKAKIDRTTSASSRVPQRLKNTPDGDGSLLDHSLFLYGSGMSNGNVHNHLNLPVLVAGGADGKLKGNRHIQVGQLAAKREIPQIAKFDKMMPMANLMVSLMHVGGIEQAHYGVDMCVDNGLVPLA